jgi:hypothetical protein
VRFANQVANTEGAYPCAEALYVHDLVLGDGATATFDNCRVYYDNLTLGDNASVEQIGCGELACETVATLTGGSFAKNRYVSFKAIDSGPDTAIRVSFASLPTPFSTFDEQVMWAGELIQVCENSGQGASVNPQDPGACGPASGFDQNWFWAASLVCDLQDAHWADWAALTDYCNGGDLDAHPCDEGCPNGSCDIDTGLCADGDNAGGACCPSGTCGVDGVVHLHHEYLVPSHMASSTGPVDARATYRVQAVSSTCSNELESSYSPPVPVRQCGWGDVVLSVAGCPNAAPDESVGVVTDVVAILNKFTNAHCAPAKARVDLQPNNVDFKIDIQDVVLCLGAFIGSEYPFGSGQCGANGLCNGGPDHNTPCTTDEDCSSELCPSGP